MATRKDGLKMTPSMVAGGSIVKLEGVLDESIEASRLSGAQGGVLVLDMDGVTRVTSFGVREWIRALAATPRDYLGFVKCRPSVISQFNMVRKFASNGEVLTFYAPYVCSACSKEYEELIDTRKQRESILNFTAPESRCPACGGEGHFDDVPASYFAFVAGAPEPAPPPLVETLLGAKAPAGAGTFKVEKEIQGTLTVFRFTGSLDGTARLKRATDGVDGNVLVLFDAVSDVTPEGLDQFDKMLAAPDIHFFLAHVPLATLTDYARRPGNERAGVISARVRLVCPNCKSNAHVDLDRAALSRLTSLHRRCTECGKDMSAVVPADQLAAVLSLPVVPVPEDVAQFLGALSPPPEPSSSPPGPPRAGNAYGRYTLLRQIGVGGMAEVFLARQQGAAGFEKTVVVKRILPHLTSDKGFVDLFLQEARTASKISHPNVVQVFDLGEVDGTYFMAMEYVRGVDLNVVLERCVQRKTPIPLEVVAYILSSVCAGLAAAHTCVDENGNPSPIIHRDVSPHNVLISVDGQVKLADFGIAKSTDSISRTPTATIKGKLAYMAPEQFNPGAAPIDARADLFSAAIVLYQCLALEHPFERTTEYLTLKAVLTDEVPWVSARRSDVSANVDALIARALSRAPDQRFQTANAMRDEILRSLSTRALGAAEFAAWLQEGIALNEVLEQRRVEHEQTALTSRPGTA